jgi:hypothetical protein
MAPLAAFVAWKLASLASTTRVVADAAPLAMVVDAAVDAQGPPTLATPHLPEAERARLLTELRALPQEGATRRGVATEDYAALLSAVDGALCASSDPAQPVFPPDAAARLAPLRLEPEARALARYVLAAGELPADAAGPLRAFLSHNPAYAPLNRPSWAIGALAVLSAPTPAHWLDLMRENTSLHRWRERAPGAPVPSGLAALCDRAAVLDAYAFYKPGPRVDLLRRFLAAPREETPIDVDGVRVQLIGADRDEAAATLTVHLRATNAGAAERPLPLAGARLSGSDLQPTVNPPATSLPAGATRDFELGFGRFTDEAAEAAILVLPPGHELGVYSELLK